MQNTYSFQGEQYSLKSALYSMEIARFVQRWRPGDKASYGVSPSCSYRAAKTSLEDGVSLQVFVHKRDQFLWGSFARKTYYLGRL